MRIREAVGRLSHRLRLEASAERKAFIDRFQSPMLEALAEVPSPMHVVVFVVSGGGGGGYTVVSSLPTEIIAMDVVQRIVDDHRRGS